MPSAFVLGGGGHLGAAEVGMLHALLERGVVPDLVVGTSVGALHGAMVARDPSVASVVQLEDTYARWLKRTDAQLRAAFDAYDVSRAAL